MNRLTKPSAQMLRGSLESVDGHDASAYPSPFEQADNFGRSQRMRTDRRLDLPAGPHRPGDRDARHPAP
jgi:hypothetical protein